MNCSDVKQKQEEGYHETFGSSIGIDLTEGNPYIGSVFADYGATVLKVEKPQGER